MNGDPIPELRDVLLRRELTADEERVVASWLARHPSAAAEWQAERALARGLRRLPDVPVATNFTRRVLDEIVRETARAERRSSRWQHWLESRWMPVAGAAAVVASVALTGWQIQTARRDADFARQVATLRAISGLTPAVLEDFEAIRRYGESSPPVDFGLLAALQ